eukprot:gnl/TRDRNA2_/TRDRNA2_159119_c0_seq2.p2 gnl/TRDRNA2_/TRDRNA2_159119_c0~~gnl/TRDRNA2_/TRDRNA2_159119_c0_seq2.p2  ORF type:complete len:181 (-),score=41.80 gnl/TRDRNA2_/TRDRNA2_159119_c0_seq2:131-673(-)
METGLISMNEYCQEDPEEARKCFGKIRFLRETKINAVVKDGLKSFGGPNGGPCDSKDVYAELIRRAEFLTADLPAHEFSRWRFLTTMWPALLLLDPRLADPESVRFRRIWYVFSSLVLAAMLFVLMRLWYKAGKKYDDIVDGHYEDIAGACAQLLHLAFVIWLLIEFCKKMLVPFLPPTK